MHKEELTLLGEAFLLGFAVSREGFNGECGFDHCAPSELKAGDGYSLAEFRQKMTAMPEFQKLQEAAVALLAPAFIAQIESKDLRSVVTEVSAASGSDGQESRRPARPPRSL